MKSTPADYFFEDPYSFLSEKYPDSYISTWNAAGCWDFTDETCRDIVLFSPSFKETSTEIIHGISVTLKKIPENEYFGVVSKDGYVGKYNLSDPCKTLIDCLKYPNLAGAQLQLSDICQNYLDSSYRDEEKLLAYAKKIKDAGMVFQVLKLNKGEV